MTTKSHNYDNLFFDYVDASANRSAKRVLHIPRDAFLAHDISTEEDRASFGWKLRTRFLRLLPQALVHHLAHVRHLCFKPRTD